MKPDKNGKIAPWRYYLAAVAGLPVPRRLRIALRRMRTRGWESRPDAGYIRDRVDFYCLPTEEFRLGKEAVRIRDITLRNTHSRYYFDLHEILGGFPGDSRIGFVQGDILKNPPFPSLMKGRRVDTGRENGVILNLDKIRHFRVPEDPVPFEKKIGKLIFRGEIDGKPARIRFMEMWADNPLCDLGDTTRKNRSRWFTEPISLEAHLQYRYILTLEGNDVSSALMWVMASNSIPVMPKPTVETWLMHSRLRPGVHYIEIKPDFSDVGEKLQYYNEHPEEAEKIAMESKKWITQFADEKRERLIADLVVEKYLGLAR